MDELKPCPFCGGEAHIQCVPHFEGKYYYGLCLTCKAKSRPEETEVSAAANWNNRTEKHGHWDITKSPDKEYPQKCSCSNCKWFFYMPENVKPEDFKRYCGSCGAKMDESEETE